MKALVQAKKAWGNVRSRVDGLVIGTMITMTQMVPALAKTKDIFDVAENMGTDVYESIRKISTPICAALFCVSLLVAHFSGDDKGTSGGRKAAIGILITWCLINGLGFIMNFVQNSGGFGGGDAIWTTSQVTNFFFMMS